MKCQVTIYRHCSTGQMYVRMQRRGRMSGCPFFGVSGTRKIYVRMQRR